MNGLAEQSTGKRGRGRREDAGTVARAKIQGTRNQSKNYLINIIRSGQMRRRLLLLGAWQRPVLPLPLISVACGHSTASSSSSLTSKRLCELVALNPS